MAARVGGVRTERVGSRALGIVLMNGFVIPRSLDIHIFFH